MTRAIDSLVIVFGLPVVDSGKVQKMTEYLLTRIIQKVEPSIQLENITIPVDEESGKTLGTAFIKCPDSTKARSLAFRGDNLPFDKSTKLRFLTRTEYEKYLNGSNQPQPEPQEKAPKVGPQHFSWYLVQGEMLDQIAFCQSKLPHAAWFNHNTAKLQVINLPNYMKQCDDIAFTNDGTFFFTKAQNRLNFYTGEDWIHFSTITVPNLQKYKNSPCGRYLLAKCSLPADVLEDNKAVPCGCLVYDILTGKNLIRIPLNKPDFNNICFGAGSVILSLQNKVLRCYKGKDFKEAIEIAKDIEVFKPSPTHKYVFTFKKSNPPKVSFHSTEEANKTIYSRPEFNTASCTPVWHPTKALCAAIQTRYVKNRETTSLTVFDLTSERSIGFLTEEPKGTILSCTWDPTNQNLATIIATPSGRQLIVYEIGKSISKLCQHPCAGVSHLSFSPAGRFLVADDIKNGSGTVEFWDTEAGRIATKNLEGVDKIKWDSSGAFLIASSSQSGSTWFSIFLLDGNQVLKNKATNLSKVIWRPRASEALLTDEDLKKVEPEVDEIIKKSGRFGAVDVKSREEEAKQNKIDKLKQWDSLKIRPANPTKDTTTITFKATRVYDDN